MPVLELDYRLTGRGWAEARVADDDGLAVFTISYLSDALGDWLDAVAVIAEGAAETRCWWEDEPGEHSWLFRREGERVRIEVTAFEDQLRAPDRERGVVVFATEQDALRVARVALSAVQRVHDAVGPAEYERRWVNHPFPVRAMGRLREAIRRAKTTG